MSRFTLTAIVVLFAGSLSPLMAQQDQFTLMMQKSPHFGGNVTPLEGLQTSGLYKLVEISANPRQGYEFAYWLGDVTDPTKRSTTVLLDSPKLVVAIFERSEMAMQSLSNVMGVSGGGPASRGFLRPNTAGYPPIMVSASPAGSSYKQTVNYVIIPVDTEEVPEPLSLALLAAGTLMLVKRKRC